MDIHELARELAKRQIEMRECTCLGHNACMTCLARRLLAALDQHPSPAPVAGGWVSVKERRLPEDGAKVLVCRPESAAWAAFVDVAYFAHPATWRNDNWHRDLDLDEITHWRPIPAPPPLSPEVRA